MLRDLARRDIPQLVPLLVRHFPEEEALLGRVPEMYEAIARRIYRWDARFLLGLLRALGRPVFRFLVIEEAGRLAATTLLTFPPAAGYVSSVMVDTPYRRRGLARRLVEAACAEAAHRGRRVAVLDVLTTNVPARTLYDSMGFHPLRSKSFFSRVGGAPPAPDARAAGSVRPLRRSDARPLVDVARAALPPAVAEVFPPTEGQFIGRDMIASVLNTESMSWVADVDGVPAGFVSANVTPAVASGHLAAPLLGRAVDDATAHALVMTAVRWLADHGRGRVVVEVLDHDARGRQILEAEGFREAMRAETLVRTL